MERYVLTGGPGCGKTSLLLALELLGEYVTREGAEDYIRLQQARGIAKPWRDKNFQLEILHLTRDREANVPKAAPWVWHDRSVLDGLAYEKQGTDTYRRLLYTGGRSHYDKIFLIELLPDVKPTKVRRESWEEAKALEEKLDSIYKTFGYTPIRIAPGGLDERIADIMWKGFMRGAPRKGFE